MLYDFTWKQFGAALGAALLAYYLILLFVFRRRGEPLAGEPCPVMGPARTDQAEMHLVSADELDFAGPGDRKVLLLGGMADLMQELKILVRVTIDEQDTRENFLSLLRLLLQDHPGSVAFHTAVTEYLLEQELPFPLTQKELEETYEN